MKMQIINFRSKQHTARALSPTYANFERLFMNNPNMFLTCKLEELPQFYFFFFADVAGLIYCVVVSSSLSEACIIT